MNKKGSCACCFRTNPKLIFTCESIWWYWASILVVIFAYQYFFDNDNFRRVSMTKAAKINFCDNADDIEIGQLEHECLGITSICAANDIDQFRFDWTGQSNVRVALCKCSNRFAAICKWFGEWTERFTRIKSIVLHSHSAGAGLWIFLQSLAEIE